MSDFRLNFRKAWLEETPAPHNPKPPLRLDDIISDINDMKPYGHIEDIGKRNSSLFKKLSVGSTIYYWYEDPATSRIQVAAAVEQEDQTLKLMAVAKDPALSKRPPWADQLYLDIIQSSAPGIMRLSSDNLLSDDGFKVWTRLLNAGAKIGYYDNTSKRIGRTFHMIDSVEQLRDLFKDESTKKYQYVLMKNDKTVSEVAGRFALRRIVEHLQSEEM